MPDNPTPCYSWHAAGEGELAGRLYVELNDDAQADRLMRQVQGVCERTGLDPESLLVLPFLA